MAATTQSNSKEKKLNYKRVSFNVNEIAPDAPAGEWGMSIPRGKCKVQPTKEDHFPMLVIPVRLDKTEEDEEVFQKALGTELTVFITFFDDSKPRAARMSKLRLRQLCEAIDVDLDEIPQQLDDPEADLQPFIKLIEGKKFTGWTQIQTRKDTGEEVTEVRFIDPNAKLGASGGDDDDDDDADDGKGGDEEEAPARSPARGKKKVNKKTTNKR